jgi:hypothetical protein
MRTSGEKYADKTRVVYTFTAKKDNPPLRGGEKTHENFAPRPQGGDNIDSSGGAFPQKRMGL